MAKRKIEVQLVGDSRSLERAFHRSERAGHSFGRAFGGIVKSLGKGALFGGAAAALGGLAVVLHEGTKEFKEHQDVAAQTAAVLKSTGKAAGISAKGVEELALHLSNLSGVEDETIASSENMLLAFTNIRNQAGKGNKIFDRATKAVLDFAVRTGRDVPQAAILLGKALEDPATKVGVLARAGIVFSSSQKKLLAQLVKTGKGLKAQKIILAELEKRFGGAAEAAGKTFSGQLGILKARFRDLSGEIVGGLFPTLQRGLTQITDFVRKLSEAKGFKAKLNIVWTGVREAASKLLDLLEEGLKQLTLHPVLKIVFTKVAEVTKSVTEALSEAIKQVDWNALWAQARGIADGLQKELERTDFSVIGKKIGESIKQAIAVALPATKELVTRINTAIKTIDFSGLGRSLGPELATAIVVAFTTLTDPAFWVKNWDLALAVAAVAFGGPLAKLGGKLAPLFIRLGNRAVVAVAAGIAKFAPRLADVFLVVMERLPGLLVKALSPLTRLVGRIFKRLGRLATFAVKVTGLTVVLNAIKNFAVKVGHVFKEIGTTIKNVFTRAFDFLKRAAIKAALAIIEPFTHLPKRLGGGSFQELKTQWQATLTQMETDAASSATAINSSLDAISRNIVVTLTVKTPDRTTDVGPGTRTTPDAGDLHDVLHPKDSSKAIVDAAEKRAAAAKAAARRASRAKAQTVKAFQTLIEGLSLDLDRATTTKSFVDDLKILNLEKQAVLREIKVEGETLDLQRQLFDIESQIADVMKDRRAAQSDRRKSNQFQKLGLTSTGDKITPSVGALGKRVGTLKNQIKGTILDTPKTTQTLRRISAVLSGKFGKVGADVRQAILGMLNEISSALDSGGESKGPLTKFAKRGVESLIEGLGLTEAQVKELRARMSQMGPGGSVPNKGTGAFGMSFSSGGPGTIVVNTTVNLDGNKIAKNTTKHQQATKGRNGGSRRGRRK